MSKPGDEVDILDVADMLGKIVSQEALEHFDTKKEIVRLMRENPDRIGFGVLSAYQLGRGEITCEQAIEGESDLRL